MEIRGNLDIEINSNVHHVERRNTETVSNRVRFPSYGDSFHHIVLSYILLCYSVMQIMSGPIGFETHERINFIFDKLSPSYVSHFLHFHVNSKNDNETKTKLLTQLPIYIDCT